MQLRPGIADPEGLTIASGLRALGFATVTEVRSGKLLRISFEAGEVDQARALIEAMCRRLLANPVMEIATWEVRADDEPSEEARLA